MKIICINNIDNTLCITVGRIYDVIGTYKSMYGNQIKYRIVNDESLLVFYNSYFFKTGSEIREERLNDILTKEEYEEYEGSL